MDHSATAHQIEETEVTPVKGAGQPVIISQAEPAANEDAYEQPREIDLFNEGGSGETTFDQKSKKAFLEWSVPGDWNIGGNGGGAMYQVSKAEKAQERDEEDLDFIAEMFERAEHAKKWDESLHTIGNQQFTGHELMNMKKWLEDAQHQEDYEDELMKKYGLTKEEARKRRIQMQELLDLYEKERLGKLTPEERKRLEELNKKPEIAQDASVIQNMADKGLEMTSERMHSMGISNSEAAARRSQMAMENKPVDSSITSVGGGIDAGIELTSLYNAKAAGMPEVADAPKVAAVAVKPKVDVVTEVNGAMGFG